MEMCLRIGLIAAMSVFVSARRSQGFQEISSVPSPEPDTLGYFDSALGLWEDTASFRANFTVTLFSAKSITEAEDGVFETESVMLQGFVAKLREDVRLQVSFVSGPTVQETTGSGQHVWSGVPRDSLVNSIFEANWFPRAEASNDIANSHEMREEKLVEGDQAVVQPRDSLHVGMIGPADSVRDVLTPVSLFGKPLRSVLSAVGPLSDADGMDSTFMVTNIKIDASVRACRLEWSSPMAYVQVKLHVSFAENVPVVNRVDYRFGGKSERDPQASLIRITCSDFRNCQGALVPATITQIFVTPGSRILSGRQFKSLDLGTEAPRHEDFQISVPENARIHGLKGWPKVVDGSRIIDLRTLAEGDVLARGEVQHYAGPNAIRRTPLPPDLTPSETQVGPRMSYGWLLFVVGLASVSLCVGYFAGWRRKRK